MSAEIDGGPAFPVVTNQYHYGYEKEIPASVAPGMSLRDYIATAVVAGFAANGAFARDDGPTIDDIVDDAYNVADAMLVARAGNEGRGGNG